MTFDPPSGVWDKFRGRNIKSLPDEDDRMEYVEKIADTFDNAMQKRRSYMEGELQKIRGWLNA